MDIKTYLVEVDNVIKNGKFKDNWESLKNHPAPKWYQQGRFGLFIHWGVYSVPSFGSEWYSRLMYQKGHPINLYHKMKYGGVEKFGYKDFIPQFTADKFCADEWLDVFKASGAKYIMPVGEHHDGFKMYQSDLSKWNTVEMGPKRDILAELKTACEKHDIGFCTSSHRAEHYWFMNGGRDYPACDVNDEKYRDFYGPAFNFTGADRKIQPTEEWLEDWLASTAEMIDKTRPLALYFDWWVRQEAFRPYMKKFLAYYYNRAEEWGQEVTVFYKCDAIMYGAATYDIERGQTAGVLPSLWQNDTAIAKNSWGYTAGNHFKSAQEILWNLVDVVSKNGCFMLNVGPKPDGTICPEEKQVLLEIGAWLEKNGEAIYAAEPFRVYGEGKQNSKTGSFRENLKFTEKDYRFTYKYGAVYVTAMKPNKKGKFVIKSFSDGHSNISFHIKKVIHLGTGEEVKFSATGSSLELEKAGIAQDMPAVFKVIVD